MADVGSSCAVLHGCPRLSLPALWPTRPPCLGPRFPGLASLQAFPASPRPVPGLLDPAKASRSPRAPPCGRPAPGQRLRLGLNISASTESWGWGWGTGPTRDSFPGPRYLGVGEETPAEERAGGQRLDARELGTPRSGTSFPRRPRARPEVRAPIRGKRAPQLFGSNAAVPGGRECCWECLAASFRSLQSSGSGAGWQETGLGDPSPLASHCGSGVRNSPGWEFRDLGSSASSAATSFRAVTTPFSLKFSLLGNGHYSPCPSFHRWWL